MTKPEIADSSRYVQKLVVLHDNQQNWEVFLASLYQVDERGSGSVDIYEPILIFVLALITDNGDILFAVFGVVFGFFYSRNIWFLFENVNNTKLSKFLWLILISFICVVGFWNLGGVRMWTAAHVFFYGSTIYFSTHQKKGLVIAASAILVHFSFLLPIGLLLIYVYAKPSHKLLFYLFVATFFISSLNLEFVSKLIQSYAPEKFETRASNYTNEDYAETIDEMKNVTNWYVVYLNKVLLWAITGIYCIFYFRIKNIKQTSLLGNKIFGFSLVLLILANLLFGVPSGGRYMLLAQLFALAAIFIIVNKNSITSKRQYIFITIPLFVFFIIVSIRIPFDTLTLDTVFSNPILALFATTGIPLIDLIK
jgi:hypothetical protein